MTDSHDADRVVSRRGFLAGGALLGFGLRDREAEAAEAGSGAILRSDRPDARYTLLEAENTIHSVCLQCNTGCGIKCKIQDGVVAKIDGNPFNPWALFPHLPFETAMDDAMPVDGSLCPKGQAGLQTAYDPYRIRRVLKRAGKRGENRWVTIPFAQAVREICEGGRLFRDVPGEESREVEGLRSLMAIRDPAMAAAIEKDVKRILGEKDRTKQSGLVAEFRRTHATALDAMIDPEHPDFGPRNNQIVVSWGRLKGGRSEFYKRFAAGLGTVNAHGHTTVCQGSLYFTCKAISDQYVDGKFSGGQKFYWQADLENSRFVLFVGANLFEANYGPPNRTVRMTDNLVTGRMKIAVADPRFSKLASKAWKWLPLKPGTDTALAMGMIRWMLENDRIDRSFLACANRAAATAAGESAWCNGSWLVRIDGQGAPGAFVRASDIGLRPAEERKMKDGAAYTEKFFVAMADGKPVAFDPNDAATPVTGDLFVDTTLADGTRVKSGLQILLDAARERSIEDWAEEAGVRPQDLIDVAFELTSHGKQAAVDIHRGPAQHTNGFYAVLGWMTVNMLLGNYGAAGGMAKASTFDTMGKGGLFPLGRQPGAIRPFGISSIRHDVRYEDTTIFAGYPAKRNWFPLASDLYQEIIPSIGDAYPYPVKALFMYMGAPTYALPAGHTNIAILQDLERLPLFVANDIVVGMTSMYADYIFPDTSFLERWEFQGSHPSMTNRVQPVRQPVMPPVPETCTVFGREMPICFESMMLGIAEALALPGFGPDAFGPGLDLNHLDDFYLRAVANLAHGEKPDAADAVPAADEREMEIFLKARRHLPESVFSEARWRSIVGESMWPRVVTVLNRGGRYENHERAYRGDRLTHAYTGLLNLYQEKTAMTIHSGTGERHPGIARHVPIMDFVGRGPEELQRGTAFSLITHRTISRTKSRTVANPWLTPLMPDNGILINPRDAERHGLSEGQEVRVTSATNVRGEWDLGNGSRKPMVGKLVFTHTMRPGVVSFALGFGHWATGAVDITIDGHVIRGDGDRARGIHANAAMWTDPTVRNTCMFDPVGGSVSFYDTRISLEPVGATV